MRANQNIHKHHKSWHFHQKLKPLSLHSTLSGIKFIYLFILYASKTIFKRCKHIQKQGHLFNMKHSTNIKYLESLLVNISLFNNLELKKYYLKRHILFICKLSRAGGVVLSLPCQSQLLLSSLTTLCSRKRQIWCGWDLKPQCCL